MRRKSHGTPVAGSSSNRTRIHNQQKSSVRMTEAPSVGGGRTQAISKAAASHKMGGTSGELANREPRFSLWNAIYGCRREARRPGLERQPHSPGEREAPMVYIGR